MQNIYLQWSIFQRKENFFLCCFSLFTFEADEHEAACRLPHTKMYSGGSAEVVVLTLC